MYVLHSVSHVVMPTYVLLYICTTYLSREVSSVPACVQVLCKPLYVLVLLFVAFPCVLRHQQTLQLSDLDPLAANIEACVGPLSPKLEGFRFFLEGSAVVQDVPVKNFDFCVEVEKFKSMVSAAADVVSEWGGL